METNTIVADEMNPGSGPITEQASESPVDFYRGERGTQYFREKFGDAMEFGRLLQLDYFRPFCSEARDLVDFGSAHGLALRRLPAKSRTGIEVNPAARKRCAELAEKEGIRVRQYDVLEDVPNESADIVISNHCLEHVPRPLDALCLIRRILRPGGQLVIVTPYDDCRSVKNRVWRERDPDYHLYTWSPMNLGNLVHAAGLDCQSVTVHHRAWSPRLFGVYRAFGRAAFDVCCWLNSYWSRRAEVVCVAKRLD
ncbi:MAG: class I SAM-dependent methyltransferase [Pirellulaceae bacterium]|nr:class I SAM-dependent methyltransferase [Planctomycetales bacterium]